MTHPDSVGFFCPISSARCLHVRWPPHLLTMLLFSQWHWPFIEFVYTFNGKHAENCNGEKNKTWHCIRLKHFQTKQRDILKRDVTVGSGSAAWVFEFWRKKSHITVDEVEDGLGRHVVVLVTYIYWYVLLHDNLIDTYEIWWVDLSVFQGNVRRHFIYFYLRYFTCWHIATIVEKKGKL